MKFLESIRHKAFWFVDFLKGNPVLKNYNEIKFINENYNAIKSQELQKASLQNLIEHAITTTSFYRKFSKDTPIENYPVIDKIMIKEDYDSFRSSKHLNAKHKVATSGSSGTPFILYQDDLKKIRNTADAIYFADRSNIPLGMEVYFMRIWTHKNKKPLVKGWIQNVKMQDIISFNDSEMESFLNKLSRNQHKKGIWGYASALDTLRKYLDAHPEKAKNCSLATIVATSEYLDSHSKQQLKKHFRAPVISRYSNAENGIFGLQNINGNDDYFINWASYYIEILSFNNNTPVEKGELGRIVITDLFNYCVPLIRYDTGDIGAIENDKNKVPVFTKIEGRKLDMLYNTKGEIISPYFVGMHMKNYPKVKQFQFIQEDKKNYTFKLNIESPLLNDIQFISEIKTFLGEDSIINLDYVDEIPLLSSGKRKLVVNKYISNAIL